MTEIILFRDGMATVFRDANSAANAIASGQYRRQPSSINTNDLTESENVSETIKEEVKREIIALNLNTASLTEIAEALDGVGISRGRKIIEARPFGSIEDVIAVYNGINWLELQQQGKVVL